MNNFWNLFYFFIILFVLYYILKKQYLSRLVNKFYTPENSIENEILFSGKKRQLIVMILVSGTFLIAISAEFFWEEIQRRKILPDFFFSKNKENSLLIEKKDFNPVTIEYIDVKIVNSNTENKETATLFYHSNGHYLAAMEGGNTLNYDGKITYFNESEIYDVKLSRNGLHYAYRLAMKDKDKSFPDRINKVISSDGKEYSEKLLELDGISDDGKDVYYRVYEIPGYIKTLIQKKNGLNCDQLSIEQRYLLQSESLYNSKYNMAKGANKCPDGNLSKESVFAKDGQSAYICNTKEGDSYYDQLIVNGVVKIKSRSLGGLILTDLGHYAAYDSLEQKAYIDEKIIPFAGNIIKINEDASHYINGYSIDGKMLDTKGMVVDYADLFGDSLYLYRLVRE